MERYDRLYELYSTFDVGTLRAYQEFVDLFPPIDSRVALDYWEEARTELDRRCDEIETAMGAPGFAAVASYATLDQAFTALDLATKYERAVNVFVLDVDETLRSAGGTDNEIPRETLYLLTRFLDEGVPIIICTGQTLENVKGFLIQGLGNELVHEGRLSIVYEGGAGVFTPGRGDVTKQLLYEELDESVRDVFTTVRSRIISDAPEQIRAGCHLQGNEFNVTLKPNFETGSPEANAVIEEALDYLLGLLGDAVVDASAGEYWARWFYAAEDLEIREALGDFKRDPDDGRKEIPDDVATTFDRIDVGYYPADAVEITSRELDKVAGVEAALDVLGVDDPFALVMGDSKSDLRVMEWVAEHDAGISAAPEHASRPVLDHVIRTDELLFDRGASDDVLRIVYALNHLVELEA